MLDLIGFGNYQFLHKIHDMWLSGQNFYSAVIIILITHILWFFGIHGGNVIMDAMPVAASPVSSAMDAVIFNKEFFDTYVYLGGAGATFGLLIALLLVGKKTAAKPGWQRFRYCPVYLISMKS